MSLSQAETFLVARFGPGVGDVTTIGHGGWSQAYAFRHGGADYVARFGAFVEDFEKDRVAARWGSRELPIPTVSEIGDAFGGYYAISERAFGEYIDLLDGARLRATLPALFAVLDAARNVDLTAATGYGLWGADGIGSDPSWRDTLLHVGEEWPGDRIYGWRKRLAASTVGSGPFDEALGHLRALVPFCPEARHLIHSDLLHYNVLVAGNRITAVVDWGCALYGDFLYDLAWFAFWSPWYPAWDGIDFRLEAERHLAAIGLDVPHVAERFRCCQIHIGLDNQKYNAFKGDWGAVEATARRTLAVARGDR